MRSEYMRMLSDCEGKLQRTAYYLTRSQTDAAKDLVQNTVVRGYEAYLRGQFTPGTNMLAWLQRILNNLFLTDENHRKKWETARSAEAPDPLLAVKAGIATEPEAALLSNIFSEPVEKALMELSYEMRVCILLVDVDELDYAQAAYVLGIPVGTVRSRLARARIRLHALLCKQEIEQE